MIENCRYFDGDEKLFLKLAYFFLFNNIRCLYLALVGYWLNKRGRQAKNAPISMNVAGLTPKVKRIVTSALDSFLKKKRITTANDDKPEISKKLFFRPDPVRDSRQRFSL